MKKFRFLEWKIYKDANELFSYLLKVVKKLPKEFRFELGSQLIRAGLSVILNIAEGSGKNSDKELNRYLGISLGSLYEVFAIVDVLKNNKFITQEQFDFLLNKINNISDQIGGFKKKLTTHYK